MTNGPYCATGSASGRPCSTNASTATDRGRQVQRAIGDDDVAAVGGHRVAVDLEAVALEHVDDAPALAVGGAGARRFAPAGMVTCQIATSDPGFAAQESGGGASGSASSNEPAITVTSLV